MVKHAITSLKLQNEGGFLEGRRTKANFKLVYLEKEKSF